MIIKVSKSTRPYTLRQDRPEWWANLIKKTEEELSALPIDQRTEKQKDLDDLKKDWEKQRAKLDEFGPTIWQVKSIDKESLIRLGASAKISLGLPTTSENEVSSTMLDFMQLKALLACKLGLIGWSNLRDADTKEEIPFDHDLIGMLPNEVHSELAREIMGHVEEEEEKN